MNNQLDQPKLLPCPFCDGDVTMQLDEDDCPFVGCDCCHFQMAAYRPGFEHMALAAWNRRSTNASPQGDEPASRPAFENWACGPTNDWSSGDLSRNSLDAYRDCDVQGQWECWQAARRIGPAQGDELPPLPKPKARANEYFSDESVYSAEEVEYIRRAAIEADRAQQGEPVETIQIFTCKGKGGKYELVGYSNGAGPKRGESIVVYCDTVNPDIFYHRSAEDFRERMEWLGVRAATKAAAPADAPTDGAQQGTKTLETRMPTGFDAGAESAPVPDTGIPTAGEKEKAGAPALPDDDKDPLYDKAVMVVRGTMHASTAAVQRTLLIGYNRASRLMEAMEKGGVVTASDDEGHRTVIAAPSHPSEEKAGEDA